MSAPSSETVVDVYGFKLNRQRKHACDSRSQGFLCIFSRPYNGPLPVGLSASLNFYGGTICEEMKKISIETVWCFISK